MLKIAMFDSKNYDIDSFQSHIKSDTHITYFEEKLNEKTISMAKGFDVVIVFVNDDLNGVVINKLVEYDVKLIALRCSGFNNVDIKTLNNRIPLVRVENYSPHAIAEHAFAMLLTIVRKTHKAYIRTRDFNFSLDKLIGFNLYDKTIGVIGTGRIGKCLIDICLGFKMKVLAFDNHKQNLNNISYVSLETLLKNSDIISLHCPLNESSKHMINKDSIKMMKKGAIIINTSRGELIDSKALLNGLKNGHISGACLDVYEEESDIFFMDKSENVFRDDVLVSLLSMPNVLITSHQAFLTYEALENIAKITMENIYSFFDKQKS